MQVQLDRQTNDGQKFVLVTCNSRTRDPHVIREWIKMLEIAEKWLKEPKPVKKP